MNEIDNQNHGEVVIYQSTDGIAKIDVLLQGETVWLTADQMAGLFQRDKSVISRHIKNVFETGELSEKSVVAFFATTASDGKRYEVTFYSLDISPPQKWKSRWRTYMPILTNAAGLSMLSKPTGKMSLNFVP